MKTFRFAAISFVALMLASPAAAQINGSSVKIGRDANISVQQDGPVTTVAIGSKAEAHTATGVVAGDVTVGRDVNINVRQKGPVTTVAIGSEVRATTATGVITSKPLW